MFLTFTGHVRKVIVEINAVLAAPIMIYAVLQTGITGGLLDKDREAEGKRLVVHHETLCLVALDKQRTYHVIDSFIICRGDMRAAVQVLILCQTNTDA